MSMYAKNVKHLRFTVEGEYTVLDHAPTLQETLPVKPDFIMMDFATLEYRMLVWLQDSVSGDLYERTAITNRGQFGTETGRWVEGAVEVYEDSQWPSVTWERYRK